jgi:hypothetical protein
MNPRLLTRKAIALAVLAALVVIVVAVAPPAARLPIALVVLPLELLLLAVLFERPTPPVSRA